MSTLYHLWTHLRLYVQNRSPIQHIQPFDMDDVAIDSKDFQERQSNRVGADW